VETVEAMHPFYVIRALGGVLFLVGALIMVYNLVRTVRGDIREEKPMVAEPAAAAAPAE
jgi:cytochrome c oxidase cbb3-type subunit 1